MTAIKHSIAKKETLASWNDVLPKHVLVTLVQWPQVVHWEQMIRKPEARENNRRLLTETWIKSVKKPEQA